MRKLFARIASLAAVTALACVPIANEYLNQFLGPGPHGQMPWA